MHITLVLEDVLARNAVYVELHGPQLYGKRIYLNKDNLRSLYKGYIPKYIQMDIEMHD